MMKSRFPKALICILLCLTTLVGCAGPITDSAPHESEVPLLGLGNPAAALGNSGDTSEAEGPEDVAFDFVTLEDVDPGVRIGVCAPAEYSREDVWAGIRFENVSSPIYTSGDANLIQPDILSAEGENGYFEIYAEDGFKQGDVYQITLEDSDLSFDGYEDNIRTYNLTTAGEAVFNARLRSDIRFLSADTLSEEDADQLKLFDGLIGYNTALGMITEDNKGVGSFTADEGSYLSGELLAVYEGTQPTERTLQDSDGGVSYVEITDVQDNGDGTAEYYYQSADQKEILFMPDVIPVQEEAAFSDGQGEIIFEHQELLFASDGEFAQLGLDENTQVDEGDFLAFYNGSPQDGEVTAYAKITDVLYSEGEGNDTVTVQYTEVSLEDMMSSMDVYRKAALTEEQILSAYDEEDVKAGILSDLNDNGMLSASTYELVEAVLDTEDVKEAFADTDLNSLQFYFGEDESVSLSGSDYEALANGADPALYASAQIDGDADVQISPNIVHFAGKMGYGTGIRAEVYAKYVITIKQDNPNAKSALKVNLVFFFEAELVMDYTVDVSTVWKYAWIFPYIYDYTITGKYADGIYIGAGFTTVATLIPNTKEKTEEEKLAGLDWPDDEVEKTPSSERVMTIAEYVKKAGGKYDKIFPAQDTGGGSLAQKYAAFAYAANNKDWVDIIDKNIFDWNGAIDPLHIIAFRVKADFVVSAELHVAIGTAINYEISCIDTFSYLLFHEGSDNAKHMEKTNGSTFRLDVYLFGAVGIRAGLRLKIMAGLFDARLDSVGFEVEGGFYGRMMGFLYGGIEVANIEKDSSKDHVYFAGGFLADAGGYVNVTFIAEMANGQISYKRPITSNEYPFFKLGTDNITTDFAYKAGDESNNFFAEFSKSNLKAVIPNGVALMSTMDMKSGTISNVSKADASLLENYNVTFDDDAFSYAYEGGKHLLILDHDKKATAGEGTVTMTLEWTGDSFGFDTDILKREIQIQWVCDVTTMQFLNKDESVFFLISKPAGSALSEADYPDTEPSAMGFTFRGWRLDGDSPKEAVLPTVMPSKNTTYVGLWDRNLVDVKIRYLLPYNKDPYGNFKYYEDCTDVISGIYYFEDSVSDIVADLSEQDLIRTNPGYNLDGKTPYTHYVIRYEDSSISCDSIAADGSTTFELALVPETVTVTFDLGDGETTTQVVDYGNAISFPKAEKDGYMITGWTNEAGETVTADQPPMAYSDAVYTAIWVEKPTTITVKAQIKEKYGISYQWKTIKIETYEMDTEAISVAELVDLLALDGYIFDEANSAYTADSIITPESYADTTVTLRFKT